MIYQRFTTCLCVVADKTKVAVAHRDLNTRNILVKEDLSCVICDFGFAMKIAGAMFIRNGVEENAENASLIDVSATPILLLKENQYF